MKSIIAEKIKLSTKPVAVYRSKECPEGARSFKEGIWGCVIGMLNSASRGNTIAFNKANVECKGGKIGLGLKSFEPGSIEYFISTGGKDDRPPEHYKKNPELALEYLQGLPGGISPDYVIFKPLEKIKDEVPDSVVFLVNADQLSGLITLSNFDKSTRDNSKVLFGYGCVQVILSGLSASDNNDDACYIGLTDPSARRCIDKDLLSFTIPYKRFLEMEENAKDCFFDTDTWDEISNRIQR